MKNFIKLKILKKFSTKIKFLIPTFSLMAILMLFGAVIINSYYSKIVSLEKLYEKISLGNTISNIIHSLQKERGLSSGYLSSNTPTAKFRKDLIFQRKISNRQIETLKRQLKMLTSHKTYDLFDKSVEQTLKNFDELPTLRKMIDSNQISSDEAIKRYSAINNSLLSIIANTAKSSHIPKITQNILTFSHFLYLKEYAGLERAQGLIILSQGQIALKNLINFTSLIAIQKQNRLMFLQYATKKIKYFYRKSIKSYVFEETKKIENAIIYNKISLYDIKPEYWYDMMTKKLDIYDSISKYIESTTTENILDELTSAKRVFYLAIGLVLISFMVFASMLYAFLKLAKEEQRLRVVMDKYVISSTTDLKGKIIDVSQAFCDISGYEKEELIGKPHNIVRHPDMPKEVFKELWDQIKQGKPWRGKIKNLKKDGSFYWVYANIEPLYNAKGEIDSYIAIRLDITEIELLNAKIKEEEEKNKAHEKLMQQQYRLAQMGEMLSMIAHQWRQPLSAITATTGSIILKAKLNKLEKQTAIELAEKIKNFSLHLSSTIDDFRNFFKSNKTKTSTNFKKIIESVLLIAESSMETNNIRLELDIGEVYEFETYENELKQVLLNLIKNAEDALIDNKVENPTITIKIDKNTIIVKDNAGGIPDEIKDKIFDPYFSTKLKKDGTGLGLYMSKLIVEDHCGGKLSVTNDRYGANFQITLGVGND